MSKEPKNVSYDPEVTKTFLTRYFNMVTEQKTIREGIKDLKDEFKDTVDLKLVFKVIRLVKAELKLQASEETVSELVNLVKDKIGNCAE